MIVDASALLAIVLSEAECERFELTILQTEKVLLPAPTWLEACMVLDRRRDGALSAVLDKVIAEFRIEIIAVTPDHMRHARDAWARYGRGKHPAGLNFGDCIVYGVAKATARPLLFKGDDFTRTDIEPALKD